MLYDQLKFTPIDRDIKFYYTILKLNSGVLFYNKAITLYKMTQNNVMIIKNNKFQSHPYHLVESSPWPFSIS